MDELKAIVEEKLKSYPKLTDRNLIRLSNYEENELGVFRIMQWNMLARALCFQDESSKTPSDAYDWEKHRKWRTLQEIIKYNSDVICLEEADFYEDIKPYLHNLGYTSIFCPKYESPCFDFEPNYGPDGCALFYKQSVFQIVNMSCEKVILDNEINSQVFIIAKLMHKPSKNFLTLVCLHLKAEQSYYRKREKQMNYILDALKIHLSGYTTDKANHPILICGDFNGGPNETFYKLIVNDTALKNLVDAYTELNNGNKEPTYIVIENSEKVEKKLDYVFYNKKALKLLACLELPLSDKLLNQYGLPNMSYSSDHFSLVCDFKFVQA